MNTPSKEAIADEATNEIMGRKWRGGASDYAGVKQIIQAAIDKGINAFLSRAMLVPATQPRKDTPNKQMP